MAVPEPLDSETRARALIISMAVRNALEEIHVGSDPGSLTDAQMAQINPIVRNAVVTALHAFANPSLSARRWLSFNTMVPDYWEAPELLEEYVKLYELDDAEPPACIRCGREIVCRLDGTWTHRSADGGQNTGCRAASFTSESLWDDAIPHTWYVKPPGR